MYKLVNRNKRSVTADLRTPLGVQIVKALVKDADIIIENYRKGTLEKWGLDYETLSKINPGLIMVRITGFGQTGPNSHRPGFGTLAEGYAGFASITGYSDRPPLLPGFGLADETSGLMGAYVYMFPNARLLVLVPFGFLFPTTIKAKFFMIFWFLSQILISITDQNISWEAHVGGFVFGYLLLRIINNKRYNV